MVGTPSRRTALAAFTMVAVVVAAVALWRQWSRASSTRSSEAAPPAPESPSDTRVARVAGAALEADATQTESDSPREPLAEPVLVGVVRARGGEPVSGALVSWSALADGAVSLDALESTQDVGPRSDVGLVETDATGRFAFVQTPGAEDAPSVLWVTHADYEAAPFALVGSASPARIECRLTPRPGFVVRVVDEQGRPLGGAVIEHTATVDRAAPSLDLELERMRRVFHRQGVTSTEPATRFAALAGLQTIVARVGPSQSAPLDLADPFGRELTLRIAPSFTVRGGVVFASGEPDGTPMLVRVESLAGKRRTALAAIPVANDLSFGPARLPCSSAPELRFELSGGGAIPPLEIRPAPRPGDDVRVDLRAIRGRTLRVKVVDDESGQPIGGARVRASSLLDRSDWRHAEATTERDGVATVQGCTDGSLVVAATARGHVKATVGPAELAGDGAELLELRLPRAGRIQGRVVHAGQPVQDFELVFWKDNPYPVQSRDFFGRSDGRFELDEVPLGEIALVVSTVDLPSTEPRRVTVSLDSVPEVELELPSGCVGRGRVIDAGDGSGLPTAKIQLWSHAGATMLSRRGSAHAVEADGSFEVRGLSAGNTHFIVEAPGYANWLAQAAGQPGAVIDLGSIPLVARRALTVQLALPTGVDPTAYTFSMRGLEYQPSVAFDADGLVQLQGIAPGDWTLWVDAPDGGWIARSLSLPAGQDWRVQFDCAGAAQLEVRVRKDTAAGWPSDLYVTCADGATRRSDEGLQQRLDASGVAEFAHVSVGEVVLTVTDAENNALFVRRASLQAGPNTVEFVLERGRGAVVLVDADGRPVVGADCALCAPEQSSSWVAYARTDELGRFPLPASPFDRLVLCAFDPSLGLMIDRAIEIGVDSAEPVVIELAAHARLRAALRDGAFVPAGLQLRVSDRAGLQHRRRISTEPDGSIAYGPTSESDFVVEVVHPGYWPSKHIVRATTGEALQTLQVRRVGSLVLRVRSAATGQVVSGVVCALDSAEFGVDVAPWVESGQSKSSSPVFATSSAGELRLDGLPNGAYRWRVGEVTGTDLVPPHGAATVDVVVP